MIHVGGLLVTAGQVQMVNQSPPTAAVANGGIDLAQGSSTSTGLVTEIITNAVDRDFSGAGNWTLNTGITVGAGVMAFTAVANDIFANLSFPYVNPDPLTSDVFLVTFTVSAFVAGGVRVIVGGGPAGTIRVANGTYTQIFVCSQDGINPNNIRIQAQGVATLAVDNISVKSIPAGTLFVSNLGASAVPATAVKIGGIAVSPEGMVYVTTDAPSSASFMGKMAVRSDGALHVSTSAVAGGDVYDGRIAVSSSGQVRVAIT